MLNTFIRGTATGSGGGCGAARVISNTIWLLLLLFLFCKRTAAFASLKVLAEVRGVARCQAAGRQQAGENRRSEYFINFGIVCQESGGG